MFKFLKEKLGSVVKKFSKDVEEESEKIPAGEEIPSPEEEKREFKRETKERKEEEKASEEKKKETKECVTAH